MSSVISESPTLHGKKNKLRIKPAVKMYAVHQLFVGQETKPPSDRRAGSRKPKPARCAITPIASRLRFVRWFVLAGRLRLLLVFYIGSGAWLTPGSLPCALRDGSPTVRKKPYVTNGSKSSIFLSRSLSGCSSHPLPHHPGKPADP